MKKFSRAGIALFVVAAMTFASCVLETDKDSDTNISGIDFTSYNTDAGFYVDNPTTNRLIAYKESLSNENLLGGIPAGAEYHGIKKNATLFNRTQAFPVILITEEQYNNNKGNLNALSQTPFTRIFVFYNHGNDNPARYLVSGKLGGRHTLLIQNPTGFDVEFRIDGPGGATLGYAAGQMLTTTLKLDDGDINIFPVFRFYNPVHGVVSTIFPKLPAGGAWFTPFAASGASPQQFTLNVKTALDSATERTLGAAWIIFRNQSTAAAGIEKGGTLITDTLGFNYIGTVAPNNERIISINMPSAGGNAFAATETEGGYKVGPAGYRVDVTDAAGNTTFTLNTDMQYVVTITGDFQQNTLKATIDLQNATSVKIEDLLPEGN